MQATLYDILRLFGMTSLHLFVVMKIDVEGIEFDLISRLFWNRGNLFDRRYISRVSLQ
jgi:hypothetical protein